MPVVITDVQIAFAAGAFFADLGAPLIEAAKAESDSDLDRMYEHYMLRSLAYAGIFLGPVATIFYLAYPGWETQYTSAIFEATRGAPSNAAYFGVFLILVFAAGWFGNWIGFRWVLRHQRIRLRLVYTGLLAITFAVFLGRFPAPVRLGTYSDFKSNPGSLPLVSDNGVFITAFAILLILDVLPLVLWYIQIRKAIRKKERGRTPEFPN